MNPQTPQAATSCTNCQAVTTNDGKTVWVCENCGIENPTATSEVTAPAVPESSPLPTAPQT